MKHQIYLSLWFDGQAKEAAEFYCSLIKNSKITSGNPIVTEFELYGHKMIGINGGPMFKMNPSISLFINLESVKEANELWDKLIVGGKAMMPIDKYPWSECYGWLQDKYGFTWQISVVTNEGEKTKLCPAMLFTGKNFGRAEEAINFYAKVFDNCSTDVLMHYPKEDPNAGKVLFSEFKIDKRNIIAMDGPGEHAYTFNEGVSFVVNCDTQKEIDNYWSQLTEGGEESMCGWLKDKFGVSWQIVPANIGKLLSDPIRSGAATRELMKMKKLDMAVLENAK